MRETLLLLLLFVIFFSDILRGEASLKGTPESLRKQVAEIKREGLVPITSDKHLEEMKALGKLVKIPGTVRIDHRLDEKWHWVLPRVALFLEDLPITFIDLFGRLFQLNSAVRTVPRQIEIIQGIGRVPPNKNAAPVDGDRMSPHLTGVAIDISKLRMYESELNWTRQRLLKQEEMGLIEATEEAGQQVFHITVFETYTSAINRGVE